MFSELEDVPMGTGTLYVLESFAEQEDRSRCRTSQQSPSKLSRGKLRREKRAMNVTETEESYVVQYLVLGGHKAYVTLGKEKGNPWLVASGIHAGAGRQVFGWSERQLCDLVLFFRDPPPAPSPSSLPESSPTRIYYHNHHGDPWHYTGHVPFCPRGSSYQRFVEKNHSKIADHFRRGLAETLSSVFPQNALFFYTTSSSCQMTHGMKVPDLVNPPPCLSKPSELERLSCGSAKECLMSALPPVREKIWLPSTKEFWDPEALKQAVAQGRATGFVTIRGGRESAEVAAQDPAGHRFGFCVQRYAPASHQVGSFTKTQIEGYFGWQSDHHQQQQGRAEEAQEGVNSQVEEFIQKQDSRTLCADTFFQEETLSTTYLAWLMKHRGFSGFSITHFLEYSFRNWGADFLEPVLQKRHDCKRAGDVVAAECLKLIGNGSYGYNGLEASNYDDLRLMTDRQLAARRRADMAHLSIKHITFLGIVRSVAHKSTKKRRGIHSTALRPARTVEFFNSEARETADGGDDDEEAEETDFEEEAEVSGNRRGPDRESAGRTATEDIYPEYSSDSGDGDLSEEDSNRYSFSQHRKLCKSEISGFLSRHRERDGGTDSDGSVDDGADTARPEENMDLEEALVSGRDLGALGETSRKIRRRKYVYRFLYAVSISGQRKSVLNSLARAVAVLSNSKRLFLGHLNVMFRCLDPRKSELCYVDTDSCIWSLSEPSLDLCLRPDRVKEWKEASIIANEEDVKSCHGLMKLEGMYRAGLFKNIKIYRLFQDDNSPVYTRCKGVGRNTAAHISDDYFLQSSRPPRLVVHRSTLRPTRAGEIHLVRESKSLAVPFNLKRKVDETGIHSVCFSEQDL